MKTSRFVSASHFQPSLIFAVAYLAQGLAVYSPAV
jgi:hypothetical protein